MGLIEGVLGRDKIGWDGDGDGDGECVVGMDWEMAILGERGMYDRTRKGVERKWRDGLGGGPRRCLLFFFGLSR